MQLFIWPSAHRKWTTPVADTDLGRAREIQEALLPRFAPGVDGYDIAGWCHPAEETGGDFFDFLEPAPDRLAVAVGDVSGHGSGAALVAVSCRAYLRAVLAQTDEPLPVIHRVNELLCKDPLDDRFVTAFLGVLRRASHRLDYVSAGQGPILLFTGANGQIEELSIQGFPLGLSPGLSFGPALGVTLAAGDFVALVTDGFFEWFNDEGECYGIERIKGELARHRDQTASEMIRRLHASVLEFVGCSPQPDDLTAVVIKRLV
jgi:serine phosphatase RsbU (regulator of sigma subunit)